MKLTRMSAVLWGSLAALALLSAALVAGGAAAGGGAEGSLPYIQLSGPDSKVTEEGFHRIRDQGAWEALWAQHVGDDAAIIAALSTAPIVDFDRCEIVAYFRGETVNTRGERVRTIEPLGGEAGRRLRFESSTYQTMSMTGEDSGVSCTPFAFWVIERADGPVVVEENVQGLKDQPSVWRQQARLEVGR